jgi:hypothetical protein
MGGYPSGIIFWNRFFWQPPTMMQVTGGCR